MPSVGYYEDWEPWFAWHPVVCQGKWVWRVPLWRRTYCSREVSTYEYMTEHNYMIHKLKGLV